MITVRAPLPGAAVIGSAARPRSNLGSEAVRIRALRPSDRDLLTLVHERLGPQSRVHRYLAPKPSLSERDLRMLSAIDGRDHAGLIAFPGSPARPIGVARYVRTGDFEVAEIAVEVIDQWQRCGVGRLLVTELRLRAVRAGVRRFAWTALESNRGVTALARGLSDHRCVYVGDGVIQCSAAIA